LLTTHHVVKGKSSVLVGPVGLGPNGKPRWLLAQVVHTDPALETVAMLMGASRARIVAKVVLPQIAPAVAVGALFAFLISFDEVVVAYFLTGASTQTLPVKMYTAIRWEVSPVLAAVSTLLTLTSLLFCLGIMALQKKVMPDSRPVAVS
jgi:ABC-type spermidine/putrescine transport system permease subunit II